MAIRIDFNRAEADQLTKIPGITRERAQQIVHYRAEHGPFHDWDEVEKIPGIGRLLAERLSKEATLGDGDTAEAAEEGAEEEEEELTEETEDEIEEDEESVDEEELAALVAVAGLDREAAAVYELVAEAIEDEGLRDMLLTFAQDHTRHVDDLLTVVEKLGGRVDRNFSPGGTLMALGSTLGMLDPDAAIEALIANEQLTNGTYETALWAVASTEAEPILRRNGADEQRHLRMLLDYQRKEEES